MRFGIFFEMSTPRPFSANQALAAVLAAGVVNNSADISSALDDLEDAGHLRQVGRNRWEVVK